MSGRLSIVATPIGCLEDITLRALRVLEDAEVVLAEDTRHTRTLCARHGITTPLRSFHAHSSEQKRTAIVEALRAGAHYALVTDAGTPLVSDPGALLVAEAAEAGVSVEAVPGPSAVVAALSIAGFASRRFAFEGFLPRKGRQRHEALDRMAHAEAATVFFESPHRIHASLRELRERVGPHRRVVLCRELTKMHEQTLRGTIDEVREALADPPKGEITVVVEARLGDAPAEEIDVGDWVAAWQTEGLTTKSMVARLQEKLGWKRNDAYRAVLDALEDED